MSEQTKIAWCDSTLNFWQGCTKVSAGCANCYAEARDARFFKGEERHWGKGAIRLKTKGAVKDALRYNEQPWICDECGMAHSNPGQICMTSGCDCETRHRRRIFSLSLGDWLDPEVPIWWLAEMLDTIRQCDQVEWILCTKRPELFFERLRLALGATGKGTVDTDVWVSEWIRGGAPKHITLLTSVENQEQADTRIPELLRIPAARRGLSLEPLLGPVDLINHLHCGECGDSGEAWDDGVCPECKGEKKLDWLIIGGESGADARPCNVEWIRSLVKQGQAAGVATFVKQLGSNARNDNGTDMNWAFNTHHPKGGEPAEWPADLRVQEWPHPCASVSIRG